MKTLLAMAALLLASPLAQAEIYRWVDENGKVHYGDKIPAKYAKTERQKLNEQGLTVDVQQREKSAEELAAEEAAKEAKEAERIRQAEQARYDNFLLSTYPDMGSLERARTDRLAIMDGQITNARKSQEESRKSLDTLEDRAQTIKKRGDPVPKPLRDQIFSIQKGLEESDRRIAKVEAEREKIDAQFRKDAARLEQLLAPSTASY